MDRNPVGWFEIYVREVPRTRAFYEGVFGIELQKIETPVGDVLELWAFPGRPDGAGASGALVLMAGGPAGGGAGTIVYFTCDDCSTQLARVADHGGTVKKNKTSIGPYGFIGLAQDPDGNLIGLHSLK